MKLRRSGLAPHRGEGPKGAVHRKPGLLGVGAHLPQRHNSGYDDAGGYEGSHARRNGKQTGRLRDGNTSLRRGPEGNSKGSAPPEHSKNGVRGTPDSHLGDAGRGGAGSLGGHDSHTDRSKQPIGESPSHAWFERLGSK